MVIGGKLGVAVGTAVNVAGAKVVLVGFAIGVAVIVLVKVGVEVGMEVFVGATAVFSIVATSNFDSVPWHPTNHASQVNIKTRSHALRSILLCLF